MQYQWTVKRKKRRDWLENTKDRALPTHFINFPIQAEREVQSPLFLFLNLEIEKSLFFGFLGLLLVTEVLLQTIRKER